MENWKRKWKYRTTTQYGKLEAKKFEERDGDWGSYVQKFQGILLS